MLANGLSGFNAAALTEIMGGELPAHLGIANRHASPAASTQSQTLEESGAFSRWASPLRAAGLGIVEQGALIGLERLPGNITGMVIR
jgi:hypothetical protein